MLAKSTGTIQGDVIRLDAPLDIPNDSRVELTIKRLDAPSGTWDDFMDELEQLCVEQPIGSGGVRYTRDELHERR